MREKRLLLVAQTTGYQPRIFADAGRRLGVEVVLATDRCHVLDDPWGDHAIPVRFEEMVESVRPILEARPFDGVAALGDRPAELAAMAAEALGLPFHPSRAVSAARNKFAARERFRGAGLPVPEYLRVALDGDVSRVAQAVEYPCVAKPLGLSASRGVIRADNPAAFAAAFERIRAILASAEIAHRNDPEDGFVQVERFIPGREFALEGLLTHGHLRTLALFDKPDPLDGPFFEETIYVTPSRAPAHVQTAIVDAARRACKALGLAHGPIHAEMRVNDRGVWMLEVAPRPIGGLCANALRFQPDTPLEELVLRHALGDDVSDAVPAATASGVMMIPIPRPGIYRGASGVEAARQVAGVDDVIITAKEGQHLLTLPEGHSYLGFIFSTGESPAMAEAALREAHAKIEFDFATALPVSAVSQR